MRRPNRGATLIEALVAISIMTVVMVFVLSAVPALRQGTESSGTRILVAYQARNLLDDLRRNGFASAASGAGTLTISGTRADSPFTVTVNYKLTVTSLAATKKDLTAQMTWHEPTGDKQLVLETLFAK